MCTTGGTDDFLHKLHSRLLQWAFWLTIITLRDGIFQLVLLKKKKQKKTKTNKQTNKQKKKNSHNSVEMAKSENYICSEDYLVEACPKMIW